MKTVFPMIAVVLLLNVSGNAFAKELPDFVKKCAPWALQELKDQAEAYGETVVPNTMTVTDLDDRWYNPSKYIWYTTQVVDRAGAKSSLTKMVQYYTFKGECI